METLETVVEKYLPRLRKVADIMVGPNEADDLVGDTLLAAVESWPKFRGDSAPQTWLMSVMRRQYFMRLRAAKYRRTGRLADQEYEDRALELNEAREAIGRLDRKHRETVVRYYYCGQSYAEIAREMDVPVGTVRSRLSQAKATLRKFAEAA